MWGSGGAGRAGNNAPFGFLPKRRDKLSCALGEYSVRKGLPALCVRNSRICGYRDVMTFEL